MEKYTYIKNSVNGSYVTLDNELPSEGYEIGTTFQDYVNGMWVLLSEEQVAFKEAHPNASVREVWNMIMPEPPIVDPVKEARDYKLSEIEFYNKSQAVDSFDVVDSNYVPQDEEDTGGTIQSWLTPAERANYRSSIDSAELVGLPQVSFYIGDLPVTLDVQNAKLMLAQIQLYADQCFIVTKQHKAAVEALDSVEAINAYDITAGYPTRLSFTI